MEFENGKIAVIRPANRVGKQSYYFDLINVLYKL